MLRRSAPSTYNARVTSPTISGRWLGVFCSCVLATACSSSPAGPGFEGRGGSGVPVGGRGGTTGTAGATGAAGRGGTTGTAGRGGTTGAAGVGGTSGAAGVGGTSGAAGVGGTSGAAGVGGTSGTAGVGGTSGTAGVGGVGGAAGAGGAAGMGAAAGTGGAAGADGGAGNGGVGGGAGTGAVAPPDNLRYWFEADFASDVIVDLPTQQQVTRWLDHSGDGWDLEAPAGGTPPTVALNEINGRPGIFFGTVTGSTAGIWSLVHKGSSTNGARYPFAQNEPHILYVVCKPSGGRLPGGTLGSSGGMLVTDRDTFSRQLWRLSDIQQRIARSQPASPTPQVILSDDPTIDFTANYAGKPLLIVYQWTGSEMFVTVNEGNPLVTTDLITGLESRSFPPVLDDDLGRNQVLEVGGSSTDESGFAGTIEAILLAPDMMPNRQTLDYLRAKWGPFEKVTN